jgi:primosomal protein N' (replication factor Y) (superfamily II helicase)
MFSLDTTDIILATSRANTLIHPDISLVVFLAFELNLSIPDYDIEEQIYTEIAYYKKQSLSLAIQTYTPEHPLLASIVWDNYKAYLATIAKERKDFSYPPYSEFVTIRIHDERKERVTHMMTHLLHKISLIESDTMFVASDVDIWERYAGEWTQKIILKDKNLEELIRTLEIEIVRNRNVTLERS